jgi:hypothetical protein
LAPHIDQRRSEVVKIVSSERKSRSLLAAQKRSEQNDQQ